MSNQRLSSRSHAAEQQLDKAELLALLDVVRAAKENRLAPVDAAVHLWPLARWKWGPVVADVLTMAEHFDGRLEDIACCYLGDGRTLVAGRLLIVGATLGMDVRIAAPRQLWPDDCLIDAAEDLAAESGARLLVTSDAGHAVLGADFLYTDSWARSAESPEARAERFEQLAPFRVTSDLIASTGKLGTKFLHRLPSPRQAESDAVGGAPRPSRRCAEVSDEVLDSGACLIREQADNRLRTSQAFIATRFPELPRARGGARAAAELRLETVR